MKTAAAFFKIIVDLFSRYYAFAEQLEADARRAKLSGRPWKTLFFWILFWICVLPILALALVFVQSADR
jgi:hypothetical protein